MSASAPVIEAALELAADAARRPTRGQWLERLTTQVAPFVRDCDLEACWPWADWPERDRRFPHASSKDIGIDAVALRRSDGEHIAIQCKARRLDERGRGDPIHKAEIDSFASASSDDFWAERWIVTNGDNPLGANAMAAVPKAKPIKMVNIVNDLRLQQGGTAREDCPHCAANPDGEDRLQTKSCMQDEAVEASVRRLTEHEQSASGGLPAGQARGKIILPCGTGKARISLRIVEALTAPGELSIVLCPSIALVAQIRREYLQHTDVDLRALAVCSDETAGYDPRKEGSRNTANDPTLDNSNVSASEVKGKVTTDPAEIARWIRAGQGAAQISVIFGTYQSGSRVAEALQSTDVTARVLIADEAHRTAGLRRKGGGKAKNGAVSAAEQRIRDFTLCHDNDAFPAVYRVYQTATPRVYDVRKVAREAASDWIVRSMDDETVFGVELYRKSYAEVVRNQWLADYRIIALGINDPDAYEQANLLASNNESKGRNALSTSDYLRGLAFALAMGGATQSGERGTVAVQSCIAFMNTVNKSKRMAQDLQTDSVKGWVQRWLTENNPDQALAPYTLEHLDASSNVTARDNAKQRLAAASAAQPHGVVNVGIFGEGTDSPSLSAVAFLEPRRSPIDVIQAVGRAMRTAPGKDIGYIICPILIPPHADPEQWLSVSSMDEGWQELGQILLALRAHDQRIEDELADLLQLYIPKPPETVRSIVAVARGADGEPGRIQFREHQGPPGSAEAAVERVAAGQSTLAQQFERIDEQPPPAVGESAPPEYEDGTSAIEPTQIITGKRNADGSVELRQHSVVRTKPKKDEIRGPIDFRKSKDRARNMINKGEGVRVTPKPRRTPKAKAEASAQGMLLLSGMEEHGNAIKMNLLAKSGLMDNRVARDLNILEGSIREAAHHLRADQLQPDLNTHFGLDNLKQASLAKQADGCTIAALLMMNAAMLHQRISNGRWLSGINDLAAVKNDVNVLRQLSREWERIMRHDFRPVLEPALEAIYAVERSGRTAGLERALRHITAEAERIAEIYADMGADHAGPLFNRVMGNQASDGAYFTRPVAAAIAARLTLDACGDLDWTDAAVWRQHKTVDLACGSGTLLAAMLTEMKRRARAQGASEAAIAGLQKLAVEETIKGLDINPVSLQLAASQLTAGNQQISYRRMGLHQMPYGPHPDDPSRVATGSLELLGQRAIVERPGELGFEDDQIGSQSVWAAADDAELEDAVEAAKDARIIIMNPPFTNRSKMGEKFPEPVQQALRKRTDSLDEQLSKVDPELKNFASRNTARTYFVTLADRCLPRNTGGLTMINPTIALSAPSGLNERRVLARRYHIHTVFTCHQPGQVNLSQNTNINESIIVLQRHPFSRNWAPQTRFIQLDKMPADEVEVDDFHRCLQECAEGEMVNGWGAVSYWPAERIAAGDWTPAIWRSSALAVAAARFASDASMKTLIAAGLSPAATGQLLRGSFERAAAGAPGSFPILKSKGADAQLCIQSQPDEHWIPKQRDESTRLGNGGTYPEASQILQKAGHLLITAGQDSKTGRLTATAADERYIDNGWMPVAGLPAEEAKALAVFINSTAGRLQMMRHPGRKISFPTYSAAEAGNIRTPDVQDDRIRRILADCWERTKDMTVPQFRDGECEVRRLWDEAVAQAMG